MSAISAVERQFNGLEKLLEGALQGLAFVAAEGVNRTRSLFEPDSDTPGEVWRRGHQPELLSFELMASGRG